MSIQTAARVLGVGEKAIRRWIAAGDLPARRFGPKLIRVDVDELEKLGTPLTLAG